MVGSASTSCSTLLCQFVNLFAAMPLIQSNSVVKTAHKVSTNSGTDLVQVALSYIRRAAVVFVTLSACILPSSKDAF